MQAIVVLALFSKIILLRHVFEKIAKMINENIRFYVKIRHRLGISINEIFKELKSAIPDSSLSLSTVTRWFNHFKSGN